MSKMTGSPDYDIALSFAGEDRAYVDVVANLLRERRVAVFYDQFEEANLWGKNLYEHLTDIYKNKARFTIMFISQWYAKKLWASQERRAAQARAFEEANEYILPARFDDTEIPGVLPTVGYISLKDRDPSDFVEIILEKLVSAGATVPSEQIRRDSGSTETLSRKKPVELRIVVADGVGTPIVSAEVFAIADNNTTIGAETDANGVARLSVHTRRKYTVWIAHPKFPCSIHPEVDPQSDLRVKLLRSDELGSKIINSTGYIPGLNGRLNPILDPHNRTYLYADNIAVNGGQQQPVTFEIDRPLELEDSLGSIFSVTIKIIRGRTSLLQYSRSA